MQKIIMIRILFVFLILTGCASSYISTNQSANRLLDEESYILAENKYQQVLNEAEAVNDIQYQAIALYGLARANGYSCNYEAAVEYFKKSIQLRKEIPDSEIAYLTQNILELARLHQSQGEFELANIEYENAIPKLIKLRVEDNDPIGLADMLDYYRQSLSNAGNMTKEKEISEWITDLKANNPGKKAGFIVKPYPSDCSA